MAPKNIMAGSRKTCASPFNPGAIPLEEMGPSSVTDKGKNVLFMFTCECLLCCVYRLKFYLFGGGLSRGPGPHKLPLQLVWKVLKESTELLVFGKVL